MIEEFCGLYAELSEANGAPSSISIFFKTEADRHTIYKKLMAELDAMGAIGTGETHPPYLLTINDCHVYLKVRGKVG